jgi:hypothetical protein
LTVGDPSPFASAGQDIAADNQPLAVPVPSITAVPEPGTLVLLLAFGLWSAGAFRRFAIGYLPFLAKTFVQPHSIEIRR